MTRNLFVASGYESVGDIFLKHHSKANAGASFAAFVEGKKIVDLWGGQQKDGSPWRDDSLCVIASGTKCICAVAVLMCVERGLIDLDAPIKSMWPEFAVGGKGEVLIGDALAHVAGVPGLERKVGVADGAVLEHVMSVVPDGRIVHPSAPFMKKATFCCSAAEELTVEQ